MRYSGYLPLPFPSGASCPAWRKDPAFRTYRVCAPGYGAGTASGATGEPFRGCRKSKWREFPDRATPQDGCTGDIPADR